jgi:hypothetical protein
LWKSDARLAASDRATGEKGQVSDLTLAALRELCDQIFDIAAYLSTEPTISREMIDRAASAYFADL